MNLAKLLRLYDAVWGAGRFPAQAGGGGLGRGLMQRLATHPLPVGYRWWAWQPSSVEAVEAAEMLGRLCLL